LKARIIESRNYGKAGFIENQELWKIVIMESRNYRKSGIMEKRQKLF